MSQDKNKTNNDLFDDLEDLEIVPEKLEIVLEKKEKEKPKKQKEEKKKGEKPKINLTELKSGLQKIKNEARQLLNLIEEVELTAGAGEVEVTQEKMAVVSPEIKIGTAGEKIIEGVFDGQNMVGPDGKVYSVPANYASKSKLVEGDILKLTILNNGSFVFKQIGPVERERLVGQLIFNETKVQYYVVINDQRWKVLTASVTYFKGQIGDEVVILTPKDCKSRWAAVENIIKNSNNKTTNNQQPTTDNQQLTTDN